MIVAKPGLSRSGIVWDVWRRDAQEREWLGCFVSLKVARVVFPDLVTKCEATYGALVSQS